MMAPLVTILTPTFNQQRFIAQCVESALAQSYFNWEQIVVDDGSTDRTRDIVASYADPRIRVLALPHRGLSALAQSYNAALAASRGAIIGVLEGDDAWPSDKLARQTPLFEDPQTVLSWGIGKQIDAEGRPAGVHAAIGSNADIRLSSSDAFRKLARRNFVAPAVTVMVRRTALEEIGGFQQGGSSLFVDLPTWLSLAGNLDGTFIFRPAVLGLYRVHSEQTSQSQRTQMTLEHVRVVRAVVEKLPQHRRALLWDDRSRREAESRGRLAEGETQLQSGDFARARESFRQAFRLHARLTDVLLALVGLLASALRVDLVGPVLRVRDRLTR